MEDFQLERCFRYLNPMNVMIEALMMTITTMVMSNHGGDWVVVSDIIRGRIISLSS